MDIKIQFFILAIFVLTKIANMPVDNVTSGNVFFTTLNNQILHDKDVSNISCKYVNDIMPRILCLICDNSVFPQTVDLRFNQLIIKIITVNIPR